MVRRSLKNPGGRAPRRKRREPDDRVGPFLDRPCRAGAAHVGAHPARHALFTRTPVPRVASPSCTVNAFNAASRHRVGRRIRAHRRQLTGFRRHVDDPPEAALDHAGTKAWLTPTAPNTLVSNVRRSSSTGTSRTALVFAEENRGVVHQHVNVSPSGSARSSASARMLCGSATSRRAWMTSTSPAARSCPRPLRPSTIARGQDDAIAADGQLATRAGGRGRSPGEPTDFKQFRTCNLQSACRVAPP